MPAIASALLVNARQRRPGGNSGSESGFIQAILGDPGEMDASMSDVPSVILREQEIQALSVLLVLASRKFTRLANGQGRRARLDVIEVAILELREALRLARIGEKRPRNYAPFRVDYLRALLKFTNDGTLVADDWKAFERLEHFL